MEKERNRWTDFSQDFKFTFTQLSEFKHISSPNVPFVVIQFRLVNDSLQSIRESMKESLKKDYLAQNGVYFLRLRDGYYIGETKDLSERLANHIKNREVDSITIATYKSEEDAMNKDSIRDLESLLLQYAIETGMSLGKNLRNLKNEGRKLLNVLDMRTSEKNAKYIWDKITYLNIRDILDEAKSQVMASNAHETAPIMAARTDGTAAVTKNVARIRTGAAKRLQDAGITRIVNMQDRPKHYNPYDPFYKIVPRRASPTTGYLIRSAEIFTKEVAKNALLDYLHKGFNNSKTDAKWTNFERNNGYVTAVTLAYLGIETAGEALGCMKAIGEGQAKELINAFIDRQYDN